MTRQDRTHPGLLNARSIPITLACGNLFAISHRPGKKRTCLVCKQDKVAVAGNIPNPRARTNVKDGRLPMAHFADLQRLGDMFFRVGGIKISEHQLPYVVLQRQALKDVL